MTAKKRAPMIQYHSSKQRTISEFDWPFQVALDEHNRWVKPSRCENRIVNISQPYVRPIIRGKQDKPVEFGAKLSVSLIEEGIARVDQMWWGAYHEGRDLKSQVEAYRSRYDHYLDVALADPAYGSRENRRYLQ